MSANEVTVDVSVRTRMAYVVTRVAMVVAPVIGMRRAMRLARWGIGKYSRYRVGRGEWKRFDPETVDAICALPKEGS